MKMDIYLRLIRDQLPEPEETRPILSEQLQYDDEDMEPDDMENQSIKPDDDMIDDNNSETDLTNLGWLTDLKNLTNWTDIVVGNGGDDDCDSGNFIGKIDDDIIEPISDKNLTEERFNKFMLQVKQNQILYADREEMYRTNENEKPPFNYAQIIAMAMMDNGKMTLKDICKWIEDRFAYFRFNDNWNNSIRHNLSLHFCFTKVARGKDEKGKGGYWELSMNTIKSERKRIRNRKKRTLALNNSSNRMHSVASKITKKLSSHPVAASIDKRDHSRTKSNTDPLNVNVEKSTTPTTKIISMTSTKANTTAAISEEIVEEIITNELENNQHLFVVHDANADTADPSTNVLITDFDHQNSLINDCANEIFLGCDIPLSGDCVIIPFIHSTQATISANQIIGNGNSGTGPNVIVEPMPYTLSEMDTVLDLEREICNLVNIPDSQLVEEGFFDYTNWQ